MHSVLMMLMVISQAPSTQAPSTPPKSLARYFAIGCDKKWNDNGAEKELWEAAGLIRTQLSKAPDESLALSLSMLLFLEGLARDLRELNAVSFLAGPFRLVEMKAEKNIPTADAGSSMADQFVTLAIMQAVADARNQLAYGPSLLMRLSSSFPELEKMVLGLISRTLPRVEQEIGAVHACLTEAGLFSKQKK